MARSRNIKPDFFRNEDLAEIPFEGRLLFIGLWCLADAFGRLEFRPKRLTADIFPYDGIAPEKTGALVKKLEEYGFIRLYSCQGKHYAEVVNFAKHQNPHKNERDKGSHFPSWEQRDVKDAGSPEDTGVSEEIEKKLEESGTDREDNGTPPADSLLMNPDSLILNPDTGNPQHRKPGDDPPGPPEQAPGDAENPVRQIFDYWKAVMGKRDNAKLTADRRAKIEARLKEKYSVDDIKRAIDGCAKSPHHMGKNDTGTVYDDLELICRTGAKLEQFANNVCRVVSEEDQRQREAEEWANGGEPGGFFSNQPVIPGEVAGRG